MKMRSMNRIRNFSIIRGVLFSLLILVSACDQLPKVTTAATDVFIPTLTTAVNTSQVSNLISAILSSPKEYAGTQVEITGYFHGWDLLGEAGGAPPVTRSDWVIADSSGAIYVTGILPEGLDPSSKKVVNTIIRLTATVKNDGKRVYLVAEKIEQIDG